MGKLIIIKGADFSQVAIGKIDIAIEIPTISWDATNGKVTLSATAGLDIYYTTNGATPTTSSTKYSAPFSVGSSGQVKAITYNGSKTSSVPKINANASIGGDDGDKLSLSSSVSGTIRYTTNGTNPTSSSTAYSSALSISSGMTIKAAVFSGSTMVSEISTIQITD